MIVKRKCLFLDRDGVINHDPGDYTMSADDFILLPDTLSALKCAQDKGYLIIIITNQGGIAKGLYTHEAVAEMHAMLRSACQNVGVEITDIFYSPHHPDFGNSLTRKPHSLLMERAIARYHIDASQSVMIGDRQRDLDCANQVGVRGIRIETNASMLPHVQRLI
ncbi:MAG: D-glycero-alpha-D-manno-heptose-1,7-bisphosphate 7-phosphatase [Flavobacteriales bacterium]